MMYIHYLKHVPFEGLGSMAPFLEKGGHQITVTNLYQGDALPGPDQFDLLVIMGGPMGVYDEQEYPWLADEKKFLSLVIEQGKTVLGICLGAQLIAAVLGAEVRRNHTREIGWFDITLDSRFLNTNFGSALPRRFTALHWHGDTFDIPEGAIPIGSSAACANQGFLFNGNVLGLQFHLEMTYETVARLISHCGDELDDSQYVQRPEEMLGDAAKFAANNKLMETIISMLLKP